jgi:hypothetical protein
MARLRTTKAIAKRIDLSYFKKDMPFRRLKRLASIAAAFLAAAWPATMAWKEDQTLYSGGPMAVRHQILAAQCRHCHRGEWGDRYVHPERRQAAMDAACRSCHPAPAHHANQTDFIQGASAARCSVCHVEHQGRAQLVALKPAHCTQCHADLKRSDAPEPHGAGCLVGASHAVAANVSDFERDHPEFAPIAAGATDPTRLKFPHDKHLKPPPAWAEAFAADVERIAGRPGVGRGNVLECGFCHQPEPSGRYMTPVAYERHCADCHPMPAWFKDAVPHETAKIVREFLRSNLADAVKTAELLPKKPDEKPREPAEWIAENLMDHELKLYLPDEGACAKCHATEFDLAQAEALPVVHPTGVHRGANEPEGTPRRWFVHSRFDHKAHQNLACIQCHASAEQSGRTEDLLMPGRSFCLSCHTSRGGARTTCVECHEFHGGRGLPFSGGSMNIDSLRR